MAMTAKVKDELSRLEVTNPAVARPRSPRCSASPAACTSSGDRSSSSGARHGERRATPPPQHRRGLRPQERHARLAAGGLRRGSRYVVRVVEEGATLARQTGLIDTRGRPVRGLPPKVVSAATCDSEAAWRGATWRTARSPSRAARRRSRSPARARGRARPRRRGRRLGIQPRPVRARRRPRRHPRRRRHRRDADAPRRARAVMAWEERRMRREVRGHGQPLANFDDANLRRSARAAVGGGTGRARHGAARRGHPRPPARSGVCCGSSTSRRASRSSASSPSPDDQGRRRRPHPATARDGRQARRGARGGGTDANLTADMMES